MRKRFYAQLNAATLLMCSAAGLNAQLASPSQISGNTSHSANQDTGWNLEISPYLWFAGAHGTVGVAGRDVSIHASAGDVLSHFDIGLMGAAEARHKRFVLNGDLMWIRLSDSHALPFLQLSTTSADARVGQLVWTSKLGYRVIEHSRIKADANVGIRFWHLAEKVNFNPFLLGLSFDSSQDWADFVIGGYVYLLMGRQTEVSLVGDVGGWDATAKLDYQFAAILGYKLRPKWTLEAGYRYLFIDYRGNNSSVTNLVTSGALVGLTYRLR